MSKKWTVEEVMELFTATVTDNFAASAKGQAHLNRIAKAITNESLNQRKATSYQTYAQNAFDKKVSEYAAKKSPKLDAFLAGKEECQSALKIDPPSASKIDPPQVAVFSS